MAPIPDDKETNPGDKDPTREGGDELEMPEHIIPPAPDTSDDDDDNLDSDSEGPAQHGYTLLPQHGGDDDEDGDNFHPYPHGADDEEGGDFPPYPPSAMEDMDLPPEPMTEVRGAGVDVSEAVAEGSVHPAFAANFPDNKIPVHLQMPKPPRTQKEDVLWNQQAAAAEQRLQMDTAAVEKVKSVMLGFKLPAANIPDWAKNVPEDQWRQRLFSTLTSPPTTKSDRKSSSCHKSKSAAGGSSANSCVESRTSSSVAKKKEEKSEAAGSGSNGT